MPSYSARSMNIGAAAALIGTSVRRAKSAVRRGAKAASSAEFWFGSLATESWGRESIVDAVKPGGSLRELSDDLAVFRVEVSSEPTDRQGSFGTRKTLSARFESEFGGFQIF